MGFRDQDTSHSRFASGTEAQRPSSPQNGYVRHNTDIGALETYQDGSWVVVGDQEKRKDGTASDRAAPNAQYLIDQGFQSNNGYYWIQFEQDATSTARQIYCDITGNVAGEGYMRIDSTWASYFSGQACNSGYGSIDANGLWKASANSGGGGPSQHGGCGISMYTPYEARYIKLTDVSFTPNGNWGGVPFPNPILHVNNDADTTYTTISPGTYPGWNPNGTIGPYEISRSSNDGMGSSELSYDMGEVAMRITHFGVAAFSGGLNRPCQMKIWFK